MSVPPIPKPQAERSGDGWGIAAGSGCPLLRPRSGPKVSRRLVTVVFQFAPPRVDFQETYLRFRVDLIPLPIAATAKGVNTL